MPGPRKVSPLDFVRSVLRSSTVSLTRHLRRLPGRQHSSRDAQYEPADLLGGLDLVSMADANGRAVPGARRDQHHLRGVCAHLRDLHAAPFAQWRAVRGEVSGLLKGI